MARIRKTKMVLRQQRDALARFRRFVPMLELKKRQLKVEAVRLERRLDERTQELRRVREDTGRWARLFCEDVGLESLLRLEEVKTREENIAGVEVKVFDEARFHREPIDLAATPLWVDDGIDALERLVTLEVEVRLLEHARRRLAEELRITTQRVNLFEKVKIPECQDIIRIIQIALGDEQIAAVARAKAAKAKRAEFQGGGLAGPERI